MRLSLVIAIKTDELTPNDQMVPYISYSTIPSAADGKKAIGVYGLGSW